MSAHFQDFQRAFGHHLRDPHHTPRPAGVPERRAAVYRELVFNNLRSFLDPCFPVSRRLLGEKRWTRLCRCFLRDWPLTTPWFREIPREFTRYLATARIAQPLPAWLAELAHYEWAELAIDIMETATPDANPAGDLLSGIIVLNPALMNLAYAWPVHRIGPHYRPRRAQATQLLVHRASDETIRFTEISPLTARLVALLAESPHTGQQAIERIAGELGQPDPARLLAFGAPLLADLQAQGIILGSQP